jgi:SPP1 gp7 family putative phage head morphogenesis protein
VKRTQKTKRIPKTRYPRGAEVFYVSELRKLLRGWIAWLKSQLTAQGVRMDATDDPKFWDSFFGEAKAEWNRRVSTFTVKIGMTARQISEISGQNWSEQQAVYLGVSPFRSEPWLEREIDGFITENVNLVKDIGDQAANRLQTIVTDGTKKGLSNKALAKQITEQLGYSDSRAKLIANDQVGKFNSNLTEIRHKKAGVTEYIWSTTKDNRVRKAHAAREGKTFSYDNPPSDGNPGQAVRCRCTSTPVFTDDMFGI